MLSLEGIERGEGKRGPLHWDIVGGQWQSRYVGGGKGERA